MQGLFWRRGGAHCLREGCQARSTRRSCGNSLTKTKEIYKTATGKATTNRRGRGRKHLLEKANCPSMLRRACAPSRKEAKELYAKS